MNFGAENLAVNVKPRVPLMNNSPAHPIANVLTKTVHPVTKIAKPVMQLDVTNKRLAMWIKV